LKTLTFYLPQFHRTPENDKWWGEGFTEWTAVKEAKPLYEGHRQPRKPLNCNYYNLMEKETMIWQADLMKQYGIDGQCFYHYYFADGKKILEKPAENLLEWKDINMPFCFDWANASWIRTWSNISGGNIWADKFETKLDEDGNGILLEQKYGREREWKEHFEYVLPFFRDSRYIRYDNKPVFLIHTPNDMPCIHQFIDYWRELANKTDIGDIYFIGVNTDQTKCGLDAVLYNAPHAFWDIKRTNKCLEFDYPIMWEKILNTKPVDGIRTFFSTIPDADNSPRKEYNGAIAKNVSVEIFQEGMYHLYQKSRSLGNEIVFINAWNEWGEGMYLEPDEDNGHAYLEAVREAQRRALESNNVVGECEDNYELKISVDWKSKLARCLNRWLDNKELGKRIADYLKNHEINSVAVYGMGMLGKQLVRELENSDIAIACIVDRNKMLSHPKYKIIGPENLSDEADALIITPIKFFDEIYCDVKKLYTKKIFSLEEIVFEL